MTITLNGTTGITTPTETATTSVTAPLLTSPASTALTIQSAGTTAMTVDTSQNVGIGTTSPGSAYRLAVSGNNTGMSIQDTGSTGTWIDFKTGSGTVQGNIYFNFTNGYMTFGTAAAGSSQTERMRIDSSGNLLVGTTTTGSARLAVVGSYISVGTSTYAAGSDNVKIANNSSNFSRSSTAASAQIYFENPNGTVGQIQTSGSATSYLTSSDYRLKEDVESLTSGLSTVSAMRPVSYKWKVDGGVGNGFIAHELQAIVPDAVSGEKDAVNEDGSIKSQGVDYSKIVVHLVAAIQELSAKNDALEAANAAFETRLAALEAK
jgi:hypothetical protein